MYKQGFYWLLSDGESPTLVFFYFNKDAGKAGFGFNTFEGGGFLPADDLTSNTDVVKADIKLPESFTGNWDYEL